MILHAGTPEPELVYARKGEVDGLHAEIKRLTAALRDAHGLIDNDLVGPWVMAHKLDAVLGIDHQQSTSGSET